ncbi:MAG: hypothetical protein JW751_08010 [Polyangiaceae bacterium]|nr:hypothetical protein [Polyangiaceae bacterium]
MASSSTLWRNLLVLVAALVLGSCGRLAPRHPEPTLTELRRAGPMAEDPEMVARWLLAELFVPGGDATQAARASTRLAGMQTEDHALAELGLGLEAWLHGRTAEAPDRFLRAVRAARTSEAPYAPFVAWFASRQAVNLRHHAPGLWRRWQGFVDQAIAAPDRLGWRARNELVDWWSAEAFAAAGPDVLGRTAQQYGCLGKVRLAGPFGRHTKRDLVSRHAAEEPGPWPERWPRADGQIDTPRRLRTRHEGCRTWADEPVADGVFYAETFLDLPADREILLAVQGAVAIWVDDVLVLDRDPRRWGEWPRFGVSLWLVKGRHRVLARLDSPRTSIRVMAPDGRPLKVTASSDGALPYSLVPVRRTGEANLISRFVKDGRVVPPPDQITRLLVAYLAHAEGQGDLAAAFMEPFVAEISRATGPALVWSALFTEHDPVYSGSQVRDLVRELQERALTADPELWQPALALTLFRAEQEGLVQAIPAMKKLAQRFGEIPAVSFALAQIYGKLGWKAEFAAAVAETVRRFPESPEALRAALDLADAAGERERADAIVRQIQALDPDSELLLTRAIEREDFAVAIRELERLGERRPDREDIAERIHRVKLAAAMTTDSLGHLAAALEKTPKDSDARLALADARFAAGQTDALQKALVDAIDRGADTEDLERAIALVEGLTELEPYRLRAEPIIAAYERSGRHQPGHAARVLDYAAVWVKSDGSSRLLEHEIVRIQSAEAITKMAEHPRLPGFALHMRVIKQDGRTLEPELVAGKTSVTFPHLEVGDYIETEQIVSESGDNADGTYYVGPHWFFREENVAYARSEFVVISPVGKDLIVEVTGDVPAPRREDQDGFEVRRWRVDESPAAPAEPNSPPLSEFLPSVQVGWGVSQQRIVRRFHDETIDLTPVDPRIARIARRIVEPASPRAKAERAQRLYRWVLANVEDGEETDGRRVVIGKQGSRARGYETLCRALGLKVDYALAQNRIAPPPRGPITEAMVFSQIVMRVGTEVGPVWLTVGNKFAPFGYLPAEVRGMPAFLLGGSGPRLTETPADGSRDGIEYEGTAVLARDGSAKLSLEQRFVGRHAMAARSDLAQLAERRLPDVLQAMVARDLRGARLDDFSIDHLDELDAPLTLKLDLVVPALAEEERGRLALVPPFESMVTNLTTLPSRQTPLLLPMATYRHVKLRVELPAGATVETPLAPVTVKNGDRRVVVADHVEQDVVVLERTVDIPAGRVQPERYPDFVSFARRADEAQVRTIRIRLQ